MTTEVVPARMGGAMVWSLMKRGLNEILRVPGAALPGMLAPTLFLLGLTAVFGNLKDLPGYPTDSFISFMVPVSYLQAAGFTGAATGVNLARDIELGWFDRLLVLPVPRWALLAGTVLSASLRVLLPFTLLTIIALAFGAHFPGAQGLAVAFAIGMVFAAIMACWGVTLALFFKTQSAAPLMQAGTFILVLFTAAYAPLDLLAGWLHDVALVNPVNHVLTAVRQGFIGDVSWHDTWPALVTLLGLGAAFGAMAVRQLLRVGR
ncbi:MAG: type transport system permease protein [Thermoleophilaceae bacterium]|jgi:ABC-2 type transport system permease protein|nr:type transport system permease protein [Thermoleophilaceae bacterium]